MIDIFMLIYLLTVVSFCAYTDWKNNKIYNKTIAYSSLPAFVLVLLFYWTHSDLLFVFLTNFISALIIGVVFFALKIWGAGDSKLWMLVNLIYPASKYIIAEHMLFPSMILLMMIFLEAYAFVIGESLYIRIFKKEKGVTFEKRAMNFEWLVNMGFSVLVLTVIYSLLSLLIGSYFESNRIFFALIGIVLTLKLSSVRQSFKKNISAALIVVYVLILVATKQSMDFKMLLLTFALVAVSQVSLKFADKYNYMWIQTSEVKKGMVLSIITIQMFMGSRIKGLPTFSDETAKCRLTEDEASAVRRWESSKTGRPQVMIVRYIPFAIFMLIGIVTYLIWSAVII